jgi:HTH-type transcriptional regulator/antitoxin HigA
MSVSEIRRLETIWHPVSEVLHKPRTEEEYDRIVELLDNLTDEVGEDENHPLASFMEILGILIEKYENEHIPEITEI